MKNTIITTLCLQLPNDTTYDYIEMCHKMLDSYLKHTNFDMHVVTNKPEAFESYGDRVIVSPYELTEYDKTVKVYDQQTVKKHGILYEGDMGDNVEIDYGMLEELPLTTHNIKQEMALQDAPSKFDEFDYTHKIVAMMMAYDLGYDVTYYMDCDLFTDGWDDVSFNNLCNNDDVDLWIGNTVGFSKQNPILLPWYTNRDKVETFGSGDGFRLKIPVIVESRLIFTNRKKFGEIIESWKGHLPKIKQSARCKPAADGFLISTAVIDTDAVVEQVTYESAGLFCSYEKIDNRGIGEVLQRDWRPFNLSDCIKPPPC